MYGAKNIKFAAAHQANQMYKYNSLKETWHKTNAAIW